jgi:DNA-binding CsgD family transcriptional regulator
MVQETAAHTESFCEISDKLDLAYKSFAAAALPWGVALPEGIVRTNPLSGIADSFDRAYQSLAALALGQQCDNTTETVKRVISSVKLKHLAYLRFSTKRSEDLTLLDALVTYPMQWQRRYFHRSYHAVDPVCKIGLTAALPFDWRSLRNSSAKIAAFLADAARHGIGVNGVTIPIRNRANGVGLMSFSSDLADLDWDEYMLRYLGKLQILACLIDAASNIKMRLPSNAMELTKREEQALAWAARGKTANDTATIMNLSYASVKTYLENARRKLSCANVTHAVAAAIATGIPPVQALKGTDPIAYSEAGAGESGAPGHETVDSRQSVRNV